MPFRHLLFNKRNGAPQRAPDAQPISLDSARFFSLDAEFPTYQWPDDDDYTTQPAPTEYNPSMMHNPHLAKNHAFTHAQFFDQPFDQSSQHSYNSVLGSSYHGSPYNFDSRSLSYSDLMDTDTSSISRGSVQSSISSTSHVDIMFDTDRSSLDSLSRKPSVTSSFTPDATSQGLCPLLSGQVGQCNPSICGPDAPCLQYVNANYVPPIEQCVPESSHNTRPMVIHTQTPNQSNTTPHEGVTQVQQRQRSATVSITSPDPVAPEAQQLTPTDETKGKPDDTKRPTTDIVTATAKKGQATQNVKRSKARQAHSLVERKYRENLNAKIQELHVRYHLLDCCCCFFNANVVILLVDVETCSLWPS